MEFPIWVVGVLLAVVSSIVSNLGYNLQVCKRKCLSDAFTIPETESLEQ